MKLIDFLKEVSKLPYREQCLSIGILTSTESSKRIAKQDLATPFNVCVTDIQRLVTKYPLIEFDDKQLKITDFYDYILVEISQIKKKVEPTADKREFIENVLSALNQVTNKGYRYSAFKNRTCILARINEGYTFDEFLHVIKCQSIKWLGTKDELYLRPETLFGTKMEGYVNSPVPTSPNTLNKLQKINDAISQAKQFDWESISKPPAA